MRNKLPIPLTIANPPEVLPGLEPYYQAFLELSTCRSVGFGVGPIPWTAIDAYARRSQLFDEDFDYFHGLIKRLDSAYIKYSDEKADQKRKRGR